MNVLIKKKKSSNSKAYEILDLKKEVAVNQDKDVLGKYMQSSTAEKIPTLARGLISAQCKQDRRESSPF